MDIVCKQFYKAVRLLFMFPLYINRFLLPAVSACPNPGAPLGLIISSRVFRFTSKLEFRFEAWGAHTDRYDKATDQKKNYRPINNKIPAIFVFNVNLWEFQWGKWPDFEYHVGK